MVFPTTLDLETGLQRPEPAFFDSQSPTPISHTPECHTPAWKDHSPSQTPECQTPKTTDREAQLAVKVFLPIITQKEHYLSTIGEALSVGLGLGSAVGIWTALNESIPLKPHVANWVAALVMGLFLAPFLDKTARLIFGKLLCVLRKPRFGNTTRLIDHLLVVLSALGTIAPLKGLQSHYGPFHASLGFEYLVFVLGFTAYSFVRSMLFTIVLGHNYERERVACSWGRLCVELWWEYLDQFHHVFVLVAENLRDVLTFATYPYLAAVWFAYWGELDPEGRYLWVAHGLNIGFFFTEFVVVKEVTYLVAAPCWSADLPYHHHHSL